MSNPLATPAGLACGIPVSAEQAQIIDHLLAHPVTVVSAGAGAGKTYTTVAAIVELLATGAAQADEFVLITFTNQAADELRQRLQSEILGQRQRHPTRAAFWAEQRERLSAAFIGTIHAFCKQVLGLHGYAQGVSREASVSFTRRIQEAAIRAEVEALLANAGDIVAELVLERNWPEHELRKRLAEIFEQARNQGLAAARLRDATRAQPDEVGS